MPADSAYGQKLALVRDPKTPRNVSLPLLRHLFLEDLVGVAQAPHLAGDLRRVAEDAVLARIPGLQLGERVSLARKSGGRTAGTLLLDRELRVVEAALGNARLTAELIVKALQYETISADAVEAIARHERWSLDYNVRLALLRQPLTSLARVLALAPQVKRRDLLEISGDPRMPSARRSYLVKLAQSPRLRI